MHGDFEAQRHWMEITTQVPMTEWYFHDLDWWGLDYPPLTAYHSWVLGLIGSFIDSTWFALYTSRGLDDPSLKIYMRATVLLSEYLVYVPAAVLFVRGAVRSQGLRTWEGNAALTALLMQPALMLVDHGHFQYNAVMLGFVLATVVSLQAQRWRWACVFFVAALGFKQMALYYAPAVFAALLAACLTPQIRPGRFLSIALVTAISFAALFAPLLVAALWNGPVAGPNEQVDSVVLPIVSSVPLISALSAQKTAWYFPPLQQLAQSIHRIFPFARGIFEDKVANVWCTLNIFIKLRQFPPALLQRASLLSTLAAITPPCVLILFRPRHGTLLYSLAGTAWGFFLFSFQVHEKSVLLPLLPMTLLLAHRGGFSPAIRAWVGWANVLGVWTMYPLLKRDQLQVPYVVHTLLWAYLLGLPAGSGSQEPKGGVTLGTRMLHLSFYALMILWHIAEAFLPPPDGKPDLWVVLNAGLGAAGFGICYMWCLWQSLRVSGLFPARFAGQGSADTAKAKRI
ncbi:MAG: Glucosyltransferase-like protein [Thelocarpon superellum]|nr:MAG: Glucosyltransferase-like protein [Thelocarpon superellum]